MTNAQQATYNKLQAKVQETYKAWQANKDKPQAEKLAAAWVKATEKADAYMMKYLSN